jgi:transposase-like protein
MPIIQIVEKLMMVLSLYGYDLMNLLGGNGIEWFWKRRLTKFNGAKVQFSYCILRIYEFTFNHSEEKIAPLIAKFLAPNNRFCYSRAKKKK